MARIKKSELIRLQRKLTTDAAIGATFGITRQAVHQLRTKYGIESVAAKNAQRNEKIVRKYKGGVSGTSLAEQYGLSISQTYRIIKDAQSSGKNRAKQGGKRVPKRKK